VTDQSANRFVLYYRGEGDPSPTDVPRILQLPGVRLVDQELPRLLLVEGPEAALKRLLEEMPQWTIGPERTISRG
jgi:hypothetical protein